ncbi:MAG: EAL domain-containing protein, partial [Burkholderiales bacterium]|nr:EAL domain-containing protein [Burkholderiales bacterium]
MVVRRLTRFSSLADTYRQTQDWTIAWPARGKDEIDNLGHSLNELVRQVHWQMEHHATHDGLTDLPNRQGLERVLAKLPYHRFGQRSHTSCLLMIDLDNFKVVNDGFGHDVGDALLRHVAAQLSATVRDEDVVARLGGDEFAILLHGVERDSVDELVQRILVNLRVPLVHAEVQVAITGSVGLAFCDGVSSPAELLRNADLAMYQAKQQGRDMCAHFNESLKVEAQRRNMLEQALRLAVRDDALHVVFQPVVDVASKRVVGIEALARWSLDGEAISPAEFIPIAEEAGLISKLGMQVLARSCVMVARLRKVGHCLPCSVNVSMRQFVENDLVTDIQQVVLAHGLPPSSIRLEITESLVAQSETGLSLAMAELYKLGFEFLLDDFGTGHSSLYRLQSLPFQTIKIDRSFVVPLERGDDVMVRTVRELARDL